MGQCATGQAQGPRAIQLSTTQQCCTRSASTRNATPPPPHTLGPHHKPCCTSNCSTHPHSAPAWPVGWAATQEGEWSARCTPPERPGQPAAPRHRAAEWGSRGRTGSEGGLVGGRAGGQGRQRTGAGAGGLLGTYTVSCVPVPARLHSLANMLASPMWRQLLPFLPLNFTSTLGQAA